MEEDLSLKGEKHKLPVSGLEGSAMLSIQMIADGIWWFGGAFSPEKEEEESLKKKSENTITP